MNQQLGRREKKKGVVMSEQLGIGLWVS